MPKDCIISINPYTTSENGNMLYSISTEWQDNEKNSWQLRVHSQDFNYPPTCSADNWIARLIYVDNNDMPHCFQFNENNENGYDFDGVFSGNNSKSSHIEISSPIDKQNLLNNLDFQNIIRQISTQLATSQKISTIIKELNLKSDGSDEEKIETIISDCLNNLQHYVRYKQTIDCFRKNMGLIEL